MNKITEEHLANISSDCHQRIQKFFNRTILRQAKKLGDENFALNNEQASRVYSYICAALSSNAISAFYAKTKDDNLGYGMYLGIHNTMVMAVNNFLDADRKLAAINIELKD